MGAIVSRAGLKALISNVFETESSGVEGSSLLCVANVETQVIKSVEGANSGLKD